MVKRLVYAALGLAAIVLVVLGSRPKPLEIATVTVSRGPLRLTVEDDGKTRVRERYTVPAPVAGTLSRVELRAGDPVEPDTIVARLLPLPSPLLDPRAREVAGQQVASTRDAELQAQAAVTRAQSAVDLARSTLARDRRLVTQGALGATEVEQAQLDAEPAVDHPAGVEPPGARCIVAGPRAGDAMQAGVRPADGEAQVAAGRARQQRQRRRPRHALGQRVLGRQHRIGAGQAVDAGAMRADAQPGPADRLAGRRTGHTRTGHTGAEPERRGTRSRPASPPSHGSPS